MVEKMRKDEGNVDNTLNAKDKQKKRKLASSATGQLLPAGPSTCYLLPANRWSLYPLPASCWSLYPLPAGPYTRYLLFPLRATCYRSRHILCSVHSPVSIAKWKNSHINFGVLLKNSILNNLNVIISKRMLLVVVGLVFFVVSLCFTETKQFIFLLLNLYTIPICLICCNTVNDFPPCRTFLVSSLMHL